MLGYIGKWAAQTFHKAFSFLLPASNERCQGAAPLNWNDLCPDVRSEIRRHLSLADHLRISQVSHDFHTASHALEHAAQQRLLSIARDACSESFLTDLGKAIQDSTTQTLTFPVDVGKGENRGGAEQVSREDINPNPNPNPNPESLPSVSHVPGLYLEVISEWYWTFAGARWVTFRVAVRGAVQGKCVWGYLSMFRLSPNAAPTAWLWIDPQHALPMLSLLCCACTAISPTQESGTLGRTHPFPIAPTLARDVQRLLGVVAARPAKGAERVRELEDEVFAAAALLNRCLGSLHIVGDPSPPWVKCAVCLSQLDLGERALYLLLRLLSVVSILSIVVGCLPFLVIRCAVLAGMSSCSLLWKYSA